MIDVAQHLRRDVRGELDDPRDAPVAVEHGIVRCLDPDGTTVLGDALELVCLRLATPQGGPERAVCSPSRSAAGTNKV